MDAMDGGCPMFFALIMLASSGIRATILAKTATNIIDNQLV
ncbi:hypothetical protein [Secundilactobacillus oryzae]|nr:hypothetical protein [Secundilactobacillus oryzae]